MQLVPLPVCIAPAHGAALSRRPRACGRSRIHILDTKADAAAPRLIKTIEADEVARKTGYSRPHTTHCGPDGIYMNALGAADGNGPGGIFMLDPSTFEIRGPWEQDRGPQQLAYDFWWHLGHDTMITSEWGTPNMVENGVNPELLLAGKYGHQLHVWDLPKRRHRQVLDLGAEYQMVLELRPAHDPKKAYGFVGVVMSLKDLSSSIWLWHRSGEGKQETWAVKKVIEIPAEPADPADLPPLLQGFKAVPPLVTDINLSLDDRFLYVSCWGTGELRQYDVSDPFKPQLTGSVHIGGIVRRAQPSASAPGAGSTAGRRWSRSAATGGASTSPTRCTGRGTSSSIPTASRDGWRRSTPTEGRLRARSRVLPRVRPGCARTRSTSKGATRRPTRTASRSVTAALVARRLLG